LPSHYKNKMLLQASITDPKSSRARLWTKRSGIQADPDGVVELVLREKLAVVAQDVLLKGHMAADFSKLGVCRLALVPTDTQPYYMAYGYPKNSPLQDAMDQMLLRVIQSGV
ncbi:Ionotropic receptor 172, partial [Hyalella azteca]